jgi:hypothetical protein
VLSRVLPEAANSAVDTVRLQHHAQDAGITDIELCGKDLHVICEAKRGWALPGEPQLRLYRSRLRECGHRAMVSMSEASAAYAALHLPKSVDGVRVDHLSWSDIHQISRTCDGDHAEKRLLAELRRYLERIVRMQDQESNLVYVVSLGSDAPEWSKLSWRQIVNEKDRYFHPVGGSGCIPRITLASAMTAGSSRSGTSTRGRLPRVFEQKFPRSWSTP